jgi:hypothetical protein
MSAPWGGITIGYVEDVTGHSAQTVKQYVAENRKLFT